MSSAALVLLVLIFPTSYSSSCVVLDHTDHSYRLTLEDIKKAPKQECIDSLSFDEKRSVPCVTLTRHGVLWMGCFNKTEHGQDIIQQCEMASKHKTLRHCDYEDHSLYREYEEKEGNSTCCCYKNSCNAEHLPHMMLRSRDSEEILLPKWRKQLRRFFAIILVLTVAAIVVAIEAVIEGYIRYRLLPKLRSYSSKRAKPTPVQEPYQPLPMPSTPSTPSTNATQRSTIRRNRTDKTESTLITTTPVVSTQKSSNIKGTKSNRKASTPRTQTASQPVKNLGSPLKLQATPTSKSKSMKKTLISTKKSANIKGLKANAKNRTLTSSQAGIPSIGSQDVTLPLLQATPPSKSRSMKKPKPLVQDTQQTVE